MENISQSKLSHDGNLNDIIFKSKVDLSEQRYIQILPVDFTSERRYDLIIALPGHGSDRWQFANDPRDECNAFRSFAVNHKMIALSPELSTLDIAPSIAPVPLDEKINTSFLVWKIYFRPSIAFPTFSLNAGVL